MHFRKQNLTGQGWCKMTHAFKLFWVHYMDFINVSTRSEFWFMYLWERIIGFGLFMFTMLMSGGSIIKMIENFSDGGSTDASAGALGTLIASLGVSVVVWFLWHLATLLPNWALQVRRLQDAGLSRAWSIALLIADIVLSTAVALGSTTSGDFETILWILSAITGITTFIFDVMPSKHNNVNGATALKKDKHDVNKIV